MTLFLLIPNTFISGCGTSGHDWTGSCLLRQFMNQPYSFYVLLGSPRLWRPDESLRILLVMVMYQ